MNNKYLISSLGWEPRFIAGFEDILAQDEDISHVILLHPTAFIERTTSILEKCKSLDVVKHKKLTIIDIDPIDHVSSWRTIEKAILGLGKSPNIVLDLTTMPRHFIWSCLHFLEHIKSDVLFKYYRPLKYGSWLSGDNGRPKLVFRHSGVAYPDRQTSLLLFSGFDLERANQIVEAIEPAKIVLITQTGEQLENIERRVTKLTGRAEMIIASIDAYAEITQTANEMDLLIKNDLSSYNVIATTVGPRPSSIPLYILNRLHPEIGLLYSQSHLYNENYSAGIELSAPYKERLNFNK